MTAETRAAKREAQRFVLNFLRSEAVMSERSLLSKRGPVRAQAMRDLADTLERQWKAEKTRSARRREAKETENAE